MLGFIINTFFSSGVGSSKGTDAIRLGSDEKKIIEKIFTLQNSNQLLETNQRVPTLFTLAAKSFVEGKYSDACSLKSTLHSVTDITDNKELLPENKAALKKQLSDKLRGIPFDKSPDLVIDIISSRIKCGEYCSSVIKDHDVYKSVLLKFAIDGPAGERVRSGESCKDVAPEYDIQPGTFYMHKLQMVAVNGPAGERVRKGESCELVASEFGIEPGSKAMAKLQMIDCRGKWFFCCMR